MRELGVSRGEWSIHFHQAKEIQDVDERRACQNVKRHEILNFEIGFAAFDVGKIIIVFRAQKKKTKQLSHDFLLVWPLKVCIAVWSRHACSWRGHGLGGGEKVGEKKGGRKEGVYLQGLDAGEFLPRGGDPALRIPNIFAHPHHSA